MDYFKFLPVEIKLDILSRLPAESVLDCKSVCSNWLSVVRHPSFTKMHVHRHFNLADDSGMLGFIVSTDDKFHYFECNENHDESTTPVQRITGFKLTKGRCRLVGSSNGLICLEAESIRICNPITGEYVLLPKLEKDTLVAGFGYVPSTGEYKVVVIHHDLNDSGRLELGWFAEVYVYTLGSGKGWRNFFISQISVLSGWEEPGIFANGTLYWLESELRYIITFDLAEEKFCEHLSLPPVPESCYAIGIGLLNGFLCFVVKQYDENDACLFDDVWLLKKKIDDHDMEVRQSLGWSKECRVDIDSVELLAITKSGGVLHFNNDYYLNIYDTKTSTSKRLVKFKNRVYGIYPHKNTLVSLKELGEENTKTMESDGIEGTRSREQLQKDADPEYIYL